jgi:hypothetical protein
VGNYIVRSDAGWVVLPTPLSEFTSYDAQVLHDGVVGWLLGAGEAMHSNGAGQQLGYVGGTLVSTIPGSAPMYQAIAPDTDPGATGFSLPAGAYQAEVSYSGSYQYVASYPGTAVHLAVGGAGSGLQAAGVLAATDTIQVDGEQVTVAYTSTQPAGHALSFHIAGDQPTNPRQYGILNATMAGPGSMVAEALPEALVVSTSNMTHTFDLDVRGPEDSGSGWFFCGGITMTTGAAIVIAAPVARAGQRRDGLGRLQPRWPGGADVGPGEPGRAANSAAGGQTGRRATGASMCRRAC